MIRLAATWFSTVVGTDNFSCPTTWWALFFVHPPSFYCFVSRKEAPSQVFFPPPSSLGLRLFVVSGDRAFAACVRQPCCDSSAAFASCHLQSSPWAFAAALASLLRCSCSCCSCCSICSSLDLADLISAVRVANWVSSLLLLTTVALFCGGGGAFERAVGHTLYLRGQTRQRVSTVTAIFPRHTRP